ncbi:MAG: amidase [Acetobacteraceae bacterium]|nr:amidase [Acetobacteraceae bacterium]
MPDRDDPFGAFVPGPRAEMAGAPSGPLGGLSFAVKDLFDIAGLVTTYGHPLWGETHGPAVATAPAVLACLQAGARMVGKTITMELAYGLTGENAWQGTPTNPAAPDRLPGGSSAGSAAAVAGRLCDFALGSDTGGSVRIPASYCGIYGIRPTWGAVSLAGAAPLAPSYDTCGWFASDAGVLRRVGDVLLPLPGAGPVGPLLRPAEVWANADAEVASALAPAMTALERLLGPALQVSVAPEGLAVFEAHFRASQAEEAWASLGPWVARHNPGFGPGVADRFAAARVMDPAKAAAGRAFRRGVAARLRGLLGGGAVMAYPTSPCPAPRRDSPQDALQAVRVRTIGVTAIAGFAGLPEVTVPAARVGGAPVGLSLVAAPGRDRALLDLAAALAKEAGLGA